jgi:hypothetical protein
VEERDASAGMTAVRGLSHPASASAGYLHTEPRYRVKGQVMSESANVKVLNAEVRVLQIGNSQLTRSMYRQLDEVTFERFEPFGRVRNSKRKPIGGVLQLVGRNTQTGALVRCDAQPPDWSASAGPEEFTHWLIHRHTPAEGSATGPDLSSRYITSFRFAGMGRPNASAMLRTSGTTRMELRSGYATTTGLVSSSSDSGAARSTSASWRVSGRSKPTVGSTRCSMRMLNTTSSRHCLLSSLRNEVNSRAPA